MKIVIVGAGLAGLGAGVALKEQGISFQILEASAEPGGLARTDVINDCFFDYTGHYLHVKTEEGFCDLIKGTTDFIKVKKQSAVLIDKKIVPYPVQYNLKYLAEKYVHKIINEISVLREKAGEKTETLSQFIESHFGKTLLDLFFKPYNEKLWGRPLDELPKDCLGNYFPKIDLELLLKSAISDVTYHGYNDFFYYPASGKISAMAEALAEKVKENIIYETEVTEIDVKKKICYSHNKKYEYDHLITSIPLSRLCSVFDSGLSDDSFKFTSLRNVRIVIKGALLHGYHWLYIPDETVPFYRLGFPQNVIDATCPPGCVSISVEIEENRRLSYTDEQIADMVVRYLVECNLIDFIEFFDVSSILIAPAYTYCMEHTKVSSAAFLEKLKRNNIITVGRYGMWKYFSMEEAYLSGKQTARLLGLGLKDATSHGNKIQPVD